MSRTALIVDDEPDVRIYLQTVLMQDGFEVRTCDNVNCAWDAVQQSEPDIVLLDIMMPQESGISLYMQIRQDKRFAELPVVIVSGVVQAGEFDFRSFVPDESVPPPNAYVEKPIDVDQFLETIEGLTAKRHGS